MLPHERFLAYRKATDCHKTFTQALTIWPARAVKDQLLRASRSIIDGIVNGASYHTAAKKAYNYSCALGSCFEVAACLDVARLIGFHTPSECHRLKCQVQETSRLVFGLRRRWWTTAEMEIAEEPGGYSVKYECPPQDILFKHEELICYNASLRAFQWIETNVRPISEPARLLTELDKHLTAVPLNIAEGNGRHAIKDHRTFNETARHAALKSSSQLDKICIERKLAPDAYAEGKQIIDRCVYLLSNMR